MISYIRGEITEITDTYVVVITEGGVGYRVHISAKSDLVSSRKIGDDIELFTSQYFRENEQGLYGFASSQERNFFEVLVTVSGIGPKLAASLLTNIDRRELAEMLVNEDVAGLVAVPGVGKKMAERLIVELRDKVLGGGYERKISEKPAERSEDVVFLTQALERLGFSTKERDDMLADAEELLEEEESVEDVLKRLLSGAQR